MDDIKYIDIKEFREFGYLQEVNRQVLHPHGLALEVEVWDREDINKLIKDFLPESLDTKTRADIRELLASVGVGVGKERLGGVWDYRDDPEGIYFIDGPDPQKVNNVAGAFLERAEARQHALGYVIQPYDHEVPDGD